MAGLTVTAAVTAELADLEERDPVLAKSSLAATALALASELDNESNSATSRAMCARAMLDTFNRLRELAPRVEEGGFLDDLSARRTARRAGGVSA